MSKMSALLAAMTALVIGMLIGFRSQPAVPPRARAAPPDANVERYRIPVDGAPQKGDPGAKVTIVEFSDFECPFCGRIEPTLAQLLARYARDVRLVWKDFPLPQHAHAQAAALAGRAAAAQGRFWQLHDAMFAHQASLERSALTALAHDVGVELGGALDDAALAAAVRKDLDDARRFAVRGTPSFFINGRPVRGPLTVEAMAPMIEEERANAERALAAGTAPRELYATLTANARTAAAPPAAATAAAGAAPVELPVAGAPVRGNDKAAVTVVVLSDFECPACGRAEPFLQKLRADWGDKVRLVWRNLPLESMHPHARLAAEAALAAGEQGKFWEMHDALFADQQHLERADLLQRAAALRLDLGRFRRALDSHKLGAAVDAELKLAERLGVNGTPTFFVAPSGASATAPLSAQRVARWNSDLGTMVADLVAGKRPAAAAAAPPAPPRVQPGRPDPAAVYRVLAGDAPAQGAARPKVTIVEYADFECPFCSRMVEPLDQIVAAHPDDVRVLFKQLPLTNHPHAQLAAEAARAAHAQGKFWPYYRALFAHQTALERPALEEYAKAAGLDLARFRADLDSGRCKSAVAAEAAEAARLGATGTPSYFIDGHFHEGAPAPAELRAQVDAALAAADARLAAGTPRARLYDALMKTALPGPEAPSLLEPQAHAVDPGASAMARGPARAPVTIVAFSDFECPFCRRAADLLASVRAQHGDKVRVVFRNFPLPYHKSAQLAAEAALAAGEQGKFWEMHDQLFAHQNALDRPSIDGIAGQLGLDLGRFGAALDKQKFSAVVRADVDAGGTLVDGTPTLFVNGHKLTNPGLLAQAVDAELRKRK